jgi:hypothetical protein
MLMRKQELKIRYRFDCKWLNAAASPSERHVLFAHISGLTPKRNVGHLTIITRPAHRKNELIT